MQLPHFLFYKRLQQDSPIGAICDFAERRINGSFCLDVEFCSLKGEFVTQRFKHIHPNLVHPRKAVKINATPRPITEAISSSP
jgi:hypothetical protein